MNEKQLNAEFARDYCIVPRDHFSGPVPRPILVKAGTKVHAAAYQERRDGMVYQIYVPSAESPGCYQFGWLVVPRVGNAILNLL